MRVDDLHITNLSTQAEVEQVKEIITGITGAVFLRADLESQTVDFGLEEDLDDLTLTDVQCALREQGFEAGDVIEGVTCRVRFKKR
ncbi:MAG: hypothetical protein GX604_04570 [Actinobacteria bacterium]|nr:hypothetical protein [Actinomycetota bacterium]